MLLKNEEELTGKTIDKVYLNNNSELWIRFTDGDYTIINASHCFDDVVLEFDDDIYTWKKYEDAAVQIGITTKQEQKEYEEEQEKIAEEQRIKHKRQEYERLKRELGL